MNYPRFAMVVGCMLSAMTISVMTLASCSKQEEPQAVASLPTAAAPAPMAQAAVPTTPEMQAPMADAPVPMAEAPVPMAEAPAPVAQAAAPTGPAVLASADGEKSGVRVEVTELKRSSGGTVSLKFVLINDADEQLGMSGYYLGDGGIGSDWQSVGAVHLVDPAGKKKYLVVRDTEKNCVCSTKIGDIKPGARANLWAKFPAPPAEVQKVSIVIPHFSPMDDVPISQ